MSITLWLCLDLPHLSLDLLQRGASDAEPLAISHDRCILHCNPAAAEFGVSPGSKLGAARMLAPGLRIKPLDNASEQAALCDLAAWAIQFTPGISLATPSSLLLEVAGSRALFGGLPALSALVRSGAQTLGYTVRLACATTALAATWFARSDHELHLETPDSLHQQLCQLSIRVLGLAESTTTQLVALGVRTIGQCLDLPRAGLTRRFGPELMLQLDRALGYLPDPRPFYQTPESFRAEIELAYPVEQVEPLLFPIHRLLLQLQGWLRGRGAAVGHVELELHHNRHALTKVHQGLLAPGRDAAHLLNLLRERLQHTALPAAVHSVILHAGQAVPFQASNLSLFHGSKETSESVLLLVERLRARLGAESVCTLGRMADHRPERAWQTTEPDAPTPACDTPGLRPLWLLSAPRPLDTRRGKPHLSGPLHLASGPERIECGWWDDGAQERDYYIARDHHGGHYWIFRESPDRWFLHGLFG